MRRLFTIALVVVSCAALRAQVPVITDNVMMPRKDLGLAVFYGNSSFKSYWEGELKRENGNMGYLFTESVMLAAAYGVTKKVTVMAMLPYVSNRASQGTLAPMKGWQDISITGKYNFFSKDYENSSLSFMALGFFSTPITDYTPDLLPVSIGMGSTNVSGRLTSNYSYKSFYVTGSGAYTWRSNVTIDRPAYYTNGQLHNTDEVKMPNTFDFIFRVGYKQEKWSADIYYTQLNTLGGGDIERQNMPFMSNRMNAGKLGASALWFLPKLKNLALRAWGDYTVTGRNVGQATSLNGGLVYRIGFERTGDSKIEP